MLDDLNATRAGKGIQHKAGWTQERTDQLVRMWNDGISAGDIAKTLAGGVTRNGVIGKVHRMNLAGRPQRPPRPKPKRAEGQKGQPKVNAIVNAVRNRRKAPTPPPMEPEPFDMEDGEGNDVTALIGIMDLTAHTCRYPSGDPLRPGFGYCGQHADKGPYCHAHTRRAYIGGRS